MSVVRDLGRSKQPRRFWRESKPDKRGCGNRERNQPICSPKVSSRVKCRANHQTAGLVAVLIFLFEDNTLPRMTFDDNSFCRWFAIRDLPNIRDKSISLAGHG